VPDRSRKTPCSDPFGSEIESAENLKQRLRRPLPVIGNRKSRRKPKSVLRLPDLALSKSAVLNSLASQSSHRTYDHAIDEFIDWYCSEPRIAFRRVVVLRYRVYLEQARYACA
jgi:hypothetical protein